MVCTMVHLVWIGTKATVLLKVVYIIVLESTEPIGCADILKVKVAVTYVRDSFSISTRVALAQNTKTGENIPNYHELYQISIKYNKKL
jgi:hypothetical protein